MVEEGNYRITQQRNISCVPVFGDTHGNIRGIYDTLSHIQQETGQKIDYALHVGDIGFMKEIPRTEKIRNDTDIELYQFLRDPSDKKFKTMPRDVTADIYFVRGNHDDNETLLRMQGHFPEGVIPVSEVMPLYLLPDGRTVYIGEQPITAYGGIDPKSRPKQTERNPNIVFFEEGLERLMEEPGEEGGILLTHQGPEGTLKGSSEIDDIVRFRNPEIHIHGHAHRISKNLIGGKIPSYGLSRMPTGRRPFLHSSGFYGILNLKEQKFSIK